MKQLESHHSLPHWMIFTQILLLQYKQTAFVYSFNLEWGHSVFDHVQYAKTKGKGLVYFIMWWCLGRQRGEWSLIERTHFAIAFFAWTRSGTFFFASWTFQTTWDRDLMIRPCLFYQSGTPPPLYLPTLTLTSFTWYNGPGHTPRFCILQAIKNWTVVKAWEWG